MVMRMRLSIMLTYICVYICYAEYASPMLPRKTLPNISGSTSYTETARYTHLYISVFDFNLNGRTRANNSYVETVI